MHFLCVSSMENNELDTALLAPSTSATVGGFSAQNVLGVQHTFVGDPGWSRKSSMYVYLQERDVHGIIAEHRF